jgi:Na+/H+ antiporter NhaD/arsenite permease-like protein
MPVALGGLLVITGYKVAFTGFKYGSDFGGLAQHLEHEWVLLANLFLLLVGFALLSTHFERSRIPDEMPMLLPDGWKGGLVLLAIVFVLSGFLDNIAAALLGGAMARHVFRRVHIGYLAAIVAAANAGGAGSVLGDTTTTMMWIDGVGPLRLLNAYIAAFVAFAVFGVAAAVRQHRFSPIIKQPPRNLKIEWLHVVIVACTLIAALVANIVTNLISPAIVGKIPVIGLAVWAVLITAAPFREPVYGG